MIHSLRLSQTLVWVALILTAGIQPVQSSNSSKCTTCEYVVYSGSCSYYETKSDCWVDVEVYDAEHNKTSTEEVCCAVKAEDCCSSDDGSLAGFIFLMVMLAAVIVLCGFAASHEPTRQRVRYYVVMDDTERAASRAERVPIVAQGIPVASPTGVYTNTGSQPVAGYPHPVGYPQPIAPQPQPIAPQPQPIAPQPQTQPPPGQYGAISSAGDGSTLNPAFQSGACEA